MFRSAFRRLPGNRSLLEQDPVVFDLLRRERRRQIEGLELIASENFTSRAVCTCLGSVATNKYSEGRPGARYYGGNGVMDELERLCQDRALQTFQLSPSEWGVNVQPYGGSTANFSALSALLRQGERLMGLELSAGGHLSHGFYTATNKAATAAARYFEPLPYPGDVTGAIDLPTLHTLARLFRPRVIIAGGSATPRQWNYAPFRALCDELGASLMIDIAHPAGFFATTSRSVSVEKAAADTSDAAECKKVEGPASSSAVITDPFAVADVVTTTTHKTLRGPRAGLIFFRNRSRNGQKVKGTCYEEGGLENRINAAVFPMLQGGPHMNVIAAVATQLLEVQSPSFRQYIEQVKRNAQRVAEQLLRRDEVLVTGGTDTHFVLWDLRKHKVPASVVELVMESALISVNKNTIVGDTNAMNSSGIRVGTSAVTTRGFLEQDMDAVVELLMRAVNFSKTIGPVSGASADTALQAAKEFVKEDPKELAALRRDVVELSLRFPFPGDEMPFPQHESTF